jgi:hypothetical protein
VYFVAMTGHGHITAAQPSAKNYPAASNGKLRDGHGGMSIKTGPFMDRA